MNIERIIEDVSIHKDEERKVVPARDYLLGLLNTYSQNGYIPSILKTRLIGSYKRKTKISPLDDIDLLIIHGTCHTQNGNWHMLEKCEFNWELQDYDESRNISSIRILNRLRNKLIESYPNSNIKRNSEVVNVYLKTYDVGFDIVPSFYCVDLNYFLIPEGSGSTKWKKTNPLIDELILNEINSKNNGKIKLVIRLAKQLFRYKKIPALRSFHLEAATLSIFKNIVGDYKLSEYLKYLYQNLTSELIRSTPDPTKISGPLNSGLNYEDINKILQTLSKACEILTDSEERYCEFAGYYD